ncbi:MAG: endonuclease/exonuclease/phosphatase family protein [Patescibacteria group bacterium]
MKLVTLNTWGGRAGKEKLLSFLKKYEDTDIFSLQEVWSAPYDHLDGAHVGGTKMNQKDVMVYGMQEISATLSSHTASFHSHHLDNYGLMMLVKNNLNIVEEGDIFVYKYKGYIPDGDIGNHARNIQYVTIQTKDGLITIINFHGLWNGKGKGDTEDRINQSKNILDFIKNLQGEYILCGDFNLLPDTKSIKIFEDYGMRNLIKDYGVKSTRTSFYEKSEKHADYIFISKGIKIKDFKVFNDEVSDHLPILLEFN